jgi:hypothetical protein
MRSGVNGVQKIAEVFRSLKPCHLAITAVSAILKEERRRFIAEY